ncbi:hypothetical protein BC2230_120025 [Burkholderia cepacia]
MPIRMLDCPFGAVTRRTGTPGAAAPATMADDAMARAAIARRRVRATRNIVRILIYMINIDIATQNEYRAVASQSNFWDQAPGVEPSKYWVGASESVPLGFRVSTSCRARPFATALRMG